MSQSCERERVNQMSFVEKACERLASTHPVPRRITVRRQLSACIVARRILCVGGRCCQRQHSDESEKEEERNASEHRAACRCARVGVESRWGEWKGNEFEELRSVMDEKRREK